MSAISILLTPGYMFAANEILTLAKLNALGQPAVQLQGQLSTQQLGAQSVTTPILALGAVTAAQMANDALGTDGTSMGVFNTGFLAALYNSQSARPLQGRTKCLAVNNVTTPNTQATITASELVLLDSSGNYFLATAVNQVVSITANGISNGLDTLVGGSGTGAAVSTWYYLYIISNGTTVQGLISANPALTSTLVSGVVSGFNYFALVGAVFNTAGSTFQKFMVVNRRAYIQEVNITGITANGTVTAYTTNVNTALPVIATVAYGTSTTTMNVSGDSNGYFGDANAVASFAVPLTVSQTVYIKGSGVSNRLSFTGYEF
jgi:hypothetical protein